MISFNAIKAENWNQWRIRVNRFIGKRQKIDSLSLKNFNIDDYLSGKYKRNDSIIEDDPWELIENKLHPDTLFKKEYDYWIKK